MIDRSVGLLYKLERPVTPTVRARNLQYLPQNLTVYVSEGSRIHLFEIVRQLSLLVEESLGSVLLHASATATATAAYLVVGKKGAGKTTTLFDMICEQGHGYLSGDRVLLSSHQGELLVRGWPDYPHVGIGTLAQHRKLGSELDIELRSPDGSLKPAEQKELIEPGDVSSCPRAHRNDSGSPRYSSIGRALPGCRERALGNGMAGHSRTRPGTGPRPRGAPPSTRSSTLASLPRVFPQYDPGGRSGGDPSLARSAVALAARQVGDQLSRVGRSACECESDMNDRIRAILF